MVAPDRPLTDFAASQICVSSTSWKGIIGRQVKHRDGRLGQEWFSGRVWRIDSVDERFEMLTSTPRELSANDHSVKLGFPVDSAGRRIWHWPSIEAEINGEVLPFLFDTGATAVCDSAALAVFDDGGPQIRAASFLAGSHFDLLALPHPEWRIIEGSYT